MVPRRPAPLGAASALAVAAAVEVILWAVLAAQNGRSLADLVDAHETTAAIGGLSFALVGAVVLRQRPGHLLGRVFAVEGQLLALSALAGQYQAHRPALPLDGVAAWMAAYLWFPAMALAAGLLTPLFPDGRPASPRWRPLVATAWVGVGGASCIVLADTPLHDADPGRQNPLALGPAAEPVLLAIAVGGLLLALGCGLVGAGLLAVRLVRATGSERGRLAWFFAAFGVGVVTTTAPVPRIVSLAGDAFVPVAFGVAMLRHGLYGGERLLNRTLVYGALSTAVAGVFALGVGLASNGLGAGSGAVVAAVVIALGLSPARDAVQRVVDRLLYGQRRDPYAALTGLGRRLDAALDPDDLLPEVTRTIAASLLLPYVAVHLGGDSLPAAAHGTPRPAEVVLPLHHRGHEVGRLVVGLPAGQRHLDPADEALLADLGRQVGAAVHAVRLTEDLRRERDRAAQAREEERHRIHRDLHDGLGPTLAGLALGLRAARRSASAAAPDAAELLDHLEDEMRGCLADVKRLVARTGPTTLEQVGLLEALRQHAETMSARSPEPLRITVSAAAALPRPPAEVELAAYRIAMEAMTNVARHAAAHRCSVDLSEDAGALVVRVRDDGVGLPAGAAPTGVGLRSMAERAAQLGGRCTVAPAAGGGVAVLAVLPVGGRP
jgi:two-component system NarL family sensor kinase